MEREAAATHSPTPPPCPFCGGARTEVMSLFGSHASLTTCWCADCRSPFEFLRWRGEPGDEGSGDDGSADGPPTDQSSNNSNAL